MVPLLQGYRIIDVTAVILGPYATQILGDLGADVIKVEPLDGDSMRVVEPVGEPGITALYANNNRNKRSITLDLKHPDGKAVLRRLIGTADALVHNMRQDAFDRLGARAARRLSRIAGHGGRRRRIGGRLLLATSQSCRGSAVAGAHKGGVIGRCICHAQAADRVGAVVDVGDAVLQRLARLGLVVQNKRSARGHVAHFYGQVEGALA